MKLGIIGFPRSGKSTVFKALTGVRGEKNEPGAPRSDQRIATVNVFDERVDFLTELYHPKKTTYAKIEYLLPSEIKASASGSDAGVLNQARICDGLLHVVRNFVAPGGSEVTPEQDFWRLEEEMVLSDLVVAEKRIERIALDRKRGKKPEGKESALLESCLEHLEKNLPLRDVPELAFEPTLKGFTFLSAKPMLVIINNDDGRLEMDIAAMSPEEAEEFLEAYHIKESALDRVIKRSYKVLNLISFFTVISDEVRAWSIPTGTPALEAAGTVHTDMQKGFIRAETLSLEDLKRCGTFQEAKKAGLVRLEGKEYEVKDGDIINFRFNI
jgi:ribosome-binding ATPase YchF (GTP1/OBG family)